MNILMMTNTYLPHVGGVANSVSLYTSELRKLGHHVMVVSPRFEGDLQDEKDVIRIPAIQHFNGSDFSVILPIPGFLDAHLKDFKPDIVHSHHPFFVGGIAVRIATKYNVPLVFTQHTRYEHYAHYAGYIPRMKQFLINLSTGYANMCDVVIAPSESFAQILKDRGVTVPIEVIATGVNIEKFRIGDGRKIRKQLNIPEYAFVAGFTGRLEQEKNLEFLSKAVAMFLHQNSKAHFLVVGYGAVEESLKEIFYVEGLRDRVHFAGKLTGNDLIDAYHSMDVFVFSSKTETQGMVLAEAMAAGVPVIAIDAAGVREVVKDGFNGHLITNENIEYFAWVLSETSHLPQEKLINFRQAAIETADNFKVSNCISKITSVYQQVIQNTTPQLVRDESAWKTAIEQIKAEWNLLANFTSAVGEALYKDNTR
ncbi:MAG: hypothetical protein A2Y10_05305 [Planctomycetes bacterium GWF2_41_51]|nr:MAG: hypothetical protein A2Y10_05305 [Planctomycetes bacterium GWF2_41_51]HBG25519.1 glycosyl transferase family 1 [Phycisphaerales bacterium]